MSAQSLTFLYGDIVGRQRGFLPCFPERSATNFCRDLLVQLDVNKPIANVEILRGKKPPLGMTVLWVYLGRDLLAPYKIVTPNRALILQTPVFPVGGGISPNPLGNSVVVGGKGAMSFDEGAHHFAVILDITLKIE